MRLLIDPLKSVDAAKAYLQAWIPIFVGLTELVYSTRETFCDLALLSKSLRQ
jgi:hypothetical protein